MFSPGSKRGPAFKPQLRVCYLCGQQFGTASIGIHLPQCYAKKLAQWEIGDPATRGRKPKNPDQLQQESSQKVSLQEWNDEQYSEFTASLAACKNCGRTFFPDRLVVHLRSCKGTGGSAAAGGSMTAASRSERVAGSALDSRRSPSPGSTNTGGAPDAKRQRSAGAASSTPRARPPRAQSSTRRGPAFKPQLRVCYLCGQQFGTASIGIHLPQCYAKKLAQWEIGDPATRGRKPKPPDASSVDSTASVEEFNDNQFAEFVNNLVPCENCGRRFLPDRLAVHLRSCRPGSTARPPPGTRVRAAESARGAASGSPSHPAKAGSDATAAGGSGRGQLDRLHPMRNRLPKSSLAPSQEECPVESGRECPRCATHEDDSNAKFCKACGSAMDAALCPQPCKHCHEPLLDGARFCPTCGMPVNGAKAAERAEGTGRAGSAGARFTTCPGCHSTCDEDSNFCDNCGAAVALSSAAESPLASPMSRSPSAGAPGKASRRSASTSGSRDPTDSTGAGDVPYCEVCSEVVPDPLAKFCEDCGAELHVRMGRAGDVRSCPPRHLPSTLSPDMAERMIPSGTAPPSLARAAQAPHPPPPRGRDPSPDPQSPATKRGERTSPASRPSASRPSPRPSVPRHAVADSVEDAETVELGELHECPTCGRRFAGHAFERHTSVCAGKKTRKQFNSAAHRLSGVDEQLAARASRRGGGAGKEPSWSPTPKPPSRWKAESEAFRKALREARMVDKVIKSGGDLRNLPPPTYSENSHYTQCPHCQRRFAPDVAARHIPKCATTVNRPKPPPRRR